LDQARRRCRSSAEALERLLERLGDLRQKPGASASQLAAAGELEAEGRRLLEQCGEPRPNWPLLETELGGQLEILGRAEEVLRQEGERYRQAVAEGEGLTMELEKLDHEVRSEGRDRPHVARAVGEAATQLEAWKTRLEALGESRIHSEGDIPPDMNGSQLCQESTEVRTKLEWARGIWRTELDLIHLAESELAAADALLRREDGRHHGHGVVADCDEGRRRLGQARDARDQWAWERVLEEARRATEAVRREASRCRRIAEEREEEERRRIAAQRAAEEAERRRIERRRRAAEAALAAARAAELAASIASRSSSWSSSQTSSSSFGRSSGSSSSRSARPSRSSSSWGGSRSGGSSFAGGGGSRSGGSRW
ncbi:MAG: hypothetical protein MI919_33805, partial [Holophagales bacterium]|nr:hypothetical protein [Holophagales bacterium]